MSKTKNRLFYKIARIIRESNDAYFDDQYHYDKLKQNYEKTNRKD